MQRILRPVLSLLLLVLPLFAVNAGWWFLSERRGEWALRQQEETARQHLESLARAWSFETQLNRLCGEFRSVLRRALQLAVIDPEARSLAGGGLPEIRRKAEKLFQKPFPDHEMWVFRLPAVATGAAIPAPDPIFTPSSTRNSRRTIGLVIEHLVSRTLERSRTGDQDRRLDKVIRALFGRAMSPQDLAMTQRGFPTPVLHQRRMFWLYWDFIQEPGSEGVCFLLLVPADLGEALAGFRLALAAHPSPKGAMSGFVRIHPDPVGDLLPRKLRRSRLFRTWRNDIGGMRRFADHEREGFKWGKPIGRYRLFPMIIPECSHIACTIVPLPPDPVFPTWLAALNLSLACGAAVVLARGWVVCVAPNHGLAQPSLAANAHFPHRAGRLLGIWTVVPLGWRFAGMFLLAVALPVVIFIIAAGAYLQEREREGRHQVQTRLLNALSGFEAGKDRLQGEYIASFRRLLLDDGFRRLLAGGGLDAAGLLERFHSHFQTRDGHLPLAYFAVIDHTGRQVASSDVALNPDEISGALRLVRGGLLGSLRERMKRQGGGHLLGPNPVSEEDRIFIDAYTGATGNSIQNEVNMGRGEPFIYNIGRGGAFQLFDHLQIDGVDRFIVFLIMRDADLDEQILKQCWNDAAIKDPEATFTAWRMRNEKLEPLLPSDRHQPTSMNTALRAAATAAARRQGMIVESRADVSLVALPARRFRSIYFAAGAPHESILSDLRNRQAEFFAFLVIGLFGALWLGRKTAQRFVQPVIELKRALDQVDSGNLDLKLDWKRPDEFGHLANSFTTMIGGLRERRQLATLVSASALEAISGGEQAEHGLAGRTISGVIMVSDIRGFTPLCETHPPDEITHLLNRHFTEMTEVITRQGGRVDKFIGDALQAVFEDRPDHPPAAIRSLHAALEMLCALDRINRSRENEGAFRYSVGIGLSAGLLLVGAIGDRRARIDYALLGSPLRRATRLESLGKENPVCPIICAPELVSQAGGFSSFLVPLRGHESEAHTFSTPPEAVFRGAQAVVAEVTHPGAGTWEPATAPGAAVQPGRREEPPTPLPEQGTPLPKATSDRRFRWSAAFACLWVVLPVLILFHSYRESLGFLRERATGDYQIRHREVIQRLRHPNFPAVQLEETLEVIGREVLTPILAARAGETEGIASMASHLEGRLATLGLPPIRVAILAGERSTTATSSGVLVHTRGIEESEKKWFHDLLNLGVYLYGGGYTGSYPEIEKGMVHAVGLDKPVRHLFHETLGCVLTTEWRGRPTWLYWQVLQSPDPTAPGWTVASEAASVRRTPVPPPKTVGAFLVLLPRGENKREELARMVTELREPEVEAVLVPATQTILPAALQRDGVVTREFLEPGSPWDIVLFSALPKRIGSGMFERPWFTATATGMVWLALLLFWRTIQGGGIAKNLAWQLQAGLILASVFPFAAVFGLLERFGVEERAGLLHQEKIKINQALDDFERQHLLARKLSDIALRRWSSTPGLIPALERASRDAAKGERADAPADPKLRTFFERVALQSRQRKPGQSVRELVIVGLDGWHCDLLYNPSGKESGDTFARTVGRLGHIVLNEIGESPGLDSAADKPGKTFVGEMGATIGLEILRTVFGPDVYFRIMQRPGESVRLYGGFGLVQLCLHLVPQVAPRFMLAWFFGGGHLDEEALYRIQDGNHTGYALFGHHRQLSGQLRRPQFCGRFDDLEKISRRVRGSRALVSTRTMIDGHPFLVEGRLGVFNSLVCLVAAGSEEQALIPSFRRRNQLLLLLITGFIATLLLAVTVSRQLLEPIRHLGLGMRDIELGRYQIRLPVERADELGDLALAFNAMARGLEERELMGRMVSRTARRTSQALSVGTDAKKRATGLLSERIDAVVMIAGIPHFEQRIGDLSPEQVFQHLSFQLSTISECVSAEGGDIDKVIGEKALIVFPGGPIGAHAALAVLERFSRAEATAGLPLGIAAGVSAGHVIAGFLGAGERRDHTVIGDTVNTAARVEGVAEKLHRERFLMTQAVVDLLSSKEVVEPFETVTVKGKKEAISLYKLRGSGGE